MSIFTVLVCGGRNYSNKSSVDTVLDGMYETHGAIRLVQGGATGADKLAREWCARQTYKLHSMVNVPADWNDVSHPKAVIRMRNGKPYNAAAGPIRNQRMLDENPIDVVLAFPGGRGTADMVKRATAAGIHVETVA